MTTSPKKTLFSGIQPTNQVTLGNYIGALRHWARLQEDFDSRFCVVDLHSITAVHDPVKLRQSTLETAATILASGVDPERSLVFIQSQVPQHAELAWVLMCQSGMGELNRMTQFKEKSDKLGQRLGIFIYPVLMAADILLYDTDQVPVGADQKQHVELARDLAERMNGLYSTKEAPLFRVPNPVIASLGARVMDLLEPTAKMSKSATNPGGCIFLQDTDDAILKKFKRAVTDSETEIRFDVETKPGVSNLLTLYACCTDQTIEAAAAHFQGKQYGHLKVETGEAVIAKLKPIRERYESYLGDRGELERVLKRGRDRTTEVAQRKLDQVYRAVGFPR